MQLEHNTPLIISFAEDTPYIGRGESLAKLILSNLLRNVTIKQQVHVSNLVSKEDYNSLDEVYQKHKFDLVIYRSDTIIVIEVNYKHGDILCKKWNRIFEPLLRKNKIIPVTIDDYNCRNLFKLDAKKQHSLTWDDYRDVIDSLQMANIHP